ncbi:hypothetical protein ACHAQJ_008026 [Trichoderma viride]
MSRSERYRESERSYSRRVYRECREWSPSRHRRDSCDCWDSDSLELYASRDPRPGNGHVQIVTPEPPAPPEPECHCRHSQNAAPPCHCTRYCAPKEVPNHYYFPNTSQSNCRSMACPRLAPPPPENFIMPVIDCSSGQNWVRNGESYDIAISPDAIVDDIISLLVPDRHDRRNKRVIVRWTDGTLEKLDSSIPVDELKRKGKRLVVEDKVRRAH